MKTKIIKANQRGHLNFGWLDTFHTFSFGEYYNREMMNFGALRVLNDDFIAPESMFPTHPHNNMEIITIVLKGTIEHQDSIGNKTQIRAGEIQVMSAGSGIFHSEKNPSSDTALNLFQIWIIPKLRDIKPAYGQQDFTQKLTLSDKWHHLVSPNGEDDTLVINQDAYISLGKFSDGKIHSYKLRSHDSGLFLMLINGSVQINGDILKDRDAIMIENVSEIEFTALELVNLVAIEVPLSFK